MDDVARSTAPADEHFDSPLERLELLAGDDEAIAAFLDEIDVRSPRERAMLAELARTEAVQRPDRLIADHRRVVAALESLRRHGFHGSRAASASGPLRPVLRWLIELVARYIVVSFVRSATIAMRNLYRFREIQSQDGSAALPLLRAAREDAEALVEITKTREIGVPAFLIGGLLIPVTVSLYRLTTGFAYESWLNATIIGLAGGLVGVFTSWVLLRGTAMASRRIRLAAREPLQALWETVGYCGDPPRDQSRKFASVGIGLTLGAWVLLPLLVGLALAD